MCYVAVVKITCMHWCPGVGVSSQAVCDIVCCVCDAGNLFYDVSSESEDETERAAV